jgi:2-hydroxychromene-2-carboxylate isomerase
MMIEYYYSLVSPWAFLGHQRLITLSATHGATIEFLPVTVSKLFPATGGLPLAKRAPERQAYRMWEIKRWPDLLGIDLNIEPAFFPADDRPAGKMVAFAKSRGGNVADLTLGCMRAVWQEERNIADADTLIAIANDHGFDGKVMFEESQGEEGEAMLEANTQRAIKAGVFGVPTYVVNGEPFWGQDRLGLLEGILAG